MPEPAVEPLPETNAGRITPTGSDLRDPVSRSVRPRWTGRRPSATHTSPFLSRWYGRNLYLLPPELINGRRGVNEFHNPRLGNGTIARIAVAQSSGYPDIDARVIKVVAAVGRFPPLPPWIDQPSWDINFHLRFPLPQAETAR